MPIRDRALIFPFDTRLSPLPPPAAGIFDEPRIPLCLNRQWAKHIAGVIQRLMRYDAWEGDFEAQYAATQQIQLFLIAFQDGMWCMDDFCCDESNELLVEIRQNQLTIINNQQTIINQGDTIINNGDTTNITSIYNQYSQAINNNYDMRILNTMLYDGTPQSIHIDVPATFATTDAEENALCQALKRYFEWQCYVGGVQAGYAQAASAAAMAAFIAAAPFTAGISVVAGLAAAAVGFTFELIQQAYSDTAALREVLCDYFEAMKGDTVTEENFQNTPAEVGEYEFYSHKYIISHQIGSSMALYPDNYLAFCRMLGEAQGQGNRADCDCCEAIEEYDIVALNDCVITRLNDFQWRVQQSNYTQPDPEHPEERSYTVKFKEIEDRCIDVIGYSESTAFYEQIDCQNTLISGIGGGGGASKIFTFIHGQNADYHDIDATLTISCPPLVFVP